MGKHKYIETPGRMWELFEQYRETIRGNDDWEKIQYVGKDGQRVTDALKVPLTLEGFENYVADLGVINDLGSYFANTKNLYDDYVTICSRIRRIIREDQITGGLLGFYNPSITQRLNGLTERSEVTVKPEEPLFGD